MHNVFAKRRSRGLSHANAGDVIKVRASLSGPSGPASDDIAAPKQLSPVLQRLDQVSLELDVEARHSGEDVRYVMIVRHTSAHVKWKHARSLDEYHAFRDRLLESLHHGHFCDAGCVWLESFLRTSFPSRMTAFSFGHSALERRREALETVIHTVHQFVLSRVNQSCHIVTTFVAQTLLEFVYGEVVDDRHALQMDKAASISPPKSDNSIELSRQSINGTMLVEAPAQAAPESTTLCAICAIPMGAKEAYVMKLRCGHRFHDECILPKLNEVLACPTCGQCDIVS